VEQAVQRALAELDFAPGELGEDQYEVTIVIPPEEGFLGVDAVDAVVEVALVGVDFDFYGPENEEMPAELLYETEPEDEYEEDLSRLEEVGFPSGAFLPVPESRNPDALRLKAFLVRVLGEMRVSGQIRVSELEEELHAEITGEDLGILIGRRGQTIDALEYLASIAVFPGAHPRKHVELDAEGYKERRRKQVERVAISKAQEAVKRGRPVPLPAMTPAERKIIHLTLRGRPDVTTASQGREPNRWVVITPTH